MSLTASHEHSWQYHKDEVTHLAMAIHHEARGEPWVGKVAVANAVLNRVDNEEFPITVRGVITQKGQFQWYHNIKLRGKTPVPDETKRLAAEMYWTHRIQQRNDNTGNAIFFSSQRCEAGTTGHRSIAHRRSCVLPFGEPELYAKKTVKTAKKKSTGRSNRKQAKTNKRIVRLRSNKQV